MIRRFIGGDSELANTMRVGNVDVALVSFQNETLTKGSTALEGLIHRDVLDLQRYRSLMDQGLVGGHN
jgi:hypothetical protein